MNTPAVPPRRDNLVENEQYFLNDYLAGPLISSHEPNR